jgi:hypothetical protein
MKKVFLIVFVLLTLLSCNKDKLPKATQTGANTFGCKVNGKIYLPKNSSALFASDPIHVDNSPTLGFIISGSQNNGTNQLSYTVQIQAPYITSTGTYDLKTYPYGEYSLDNSPHQFFKTNQSYSGQLTITRCDNGNKIYSGTFFFTAIDNATGQTVKVTDGRFDVKK